MPKHAQEAIQHAPNDHWQRLAEASVVAGNPPTRDFRLQAGQAGSAAKHAEALRLHEPAGLFTPHTFDFRIIFQLANKLSDQFAAGRIVQHLVNTHSSSRPLVHSSTRPTLGRTFLTKLSNAAPHKDLTRLSHAFPSPLRIHIPPSFHISFHQHLMASA